MIIKENYELPAGLFSNSEDILDFSDNFNFDLDKGTNRGPGSALESIKTTASPLKIEPTAQELKKLDKQITELKRKKSELFGVEEQAIGLISAKIKDVEEKVKKIKEISLYGQHYLRLNLNPLKWRNNQGFPRLVVFNISEPRFKIAISFDWKGIAYIEIGPNLPKCFGDCYSDVLDLLKNMSKQRQQKLRYMEHGEYSLSCQFRGLIPDDTKEKINKSIVENHFSKNSLFIITEPTDLKLNQEFFSIPDPLVVGCSDNFVWLIDDFDTTPIEESLIFEPI